MDFPSLDLPVAPPYPPMEARSVDALPEGAEWLYEPKWDGFRCLVFRDGDRVALQSKSGQPLTRYFPELVAALVGLPPRRFVIDGEIVVPVEGTLSFDALLQRIHPAERRVQKLAHETPAVLLVFDLLVDERPTDLTARPLAERRERLARLFASWPESATVRLSPSTPEVATARGWMRDLLASGLDGVIAKRRDVPYASGERTAMVKVKKLRTADCVVGGFRWAERGGQVGSLLLGLYDDEGLLHHVGFSSSFSAPERAKLRPIVEPLVRPPGFTGHAPGGPSRWSSGRSAEWQPLEPSLVCEVRYDHFSGDRFRHGTKFLRWRPDKTPRQCTFAQVRGAPRVADIAALGVAGER